MCYILLATSKSQKQALTTAAAQSKKDVTDEGAEEEDVEFDPVRISLYEQHLVIHYIYMMLFEGLKTEKVEQL